MAGFIDQLCLRRDKGSLECSLTGGRAGTLMRESVVHEAPLFVAALIKEISGRGSGPLTLLGLASAAPREWIVQMFPQYLSQVVEHVYYRTHKRVSAVRLTRFLDLVIDRQHLPAPDPGASGRALAEAYAEGLFELPLFNHEIKQFIARVNLAAQALPELEIPPLGPAAVLHCLAAAFKGLTLAKEAQALPPRAAVLAHLPAEQRQWLDELTPLAIPWPGDKKLKLTYIENSGEKGGPINAPEIQVKIQECFGLKEHPRICEGKVAVRLWVCAPDGKRLDSTLDWLSFRQNQYPRIKPALQKKFPSLLWV
jgi:ATP-dependent helicase HrpB